MKTANLTVRQLEFLEFFAYRLANRYQELSARIQRAVRIVEAGGVGVEASGAVRVRSGSSAPYRVTLEGCECEDFRRGKAPLGMCKHRLAFYVAQQTLRLCRPDDADTGS